METFAPTANRSSHRRTGVLAVMKGRQCEVLDVSAAFLKGLSFEELKELGYGR